MKGKRTYLIVGVALLYLLGSKLNLWPLDPQLIAALGAITLAFLRAGVSDLKSEISNPKSDPVPNGSRLPSRLLLLFAYFAFSAVKTFGADPPPPPPIPDHVLRTNIVVTYTNVPLVYFYGIRSDTHLVLIDHCPENEYCGSTCKDFVAIFSARRPVHLTPIWAVQPQSPWPPLGAGGMSPATTNTPASPK